MRIIVVAIFAAFCMLGSVSIAAAGTYQSDGTYTGTPSPVVTRLFAAFPCRDNTPCDGLVDAIRQLLINDPTLADDVAFVASRGNAAQQSAAAAGMAQALLALANRGDRAGAAQIARAAQLSGNEVIQTTVLAAIGAGGGGKDLFIGGNPATLGCANNIVSPSSPCK